MMNKKIAVVGRGKTGSAIAKALGGDLGPVFSTENPLDLDQLRDVWAMIVFVPAHALEQILPKLIEAGKPVVCGTTGFPWPADFDQILKTKNFTWIVGSNFSPGMNFLFAVAELANLNRDLLDQPAFSVHEIHHVHKLDSPSGTALSLKQRTGGSETPVTSERIGDHPGFHELSISTPFERLKFQHDALAREAFARGAVYAAKSLLSERGSGLHFFSEIMSTKIFSNLAERQESHE